MPCLFYFFPSTLFIPRLSLIQARLDREFVLNSRFLSKSQITAMVAANQSWSSLNKRDPRGCQMSTQSQMDSSDAEV